MKFGVEFHEKAERQFFGWTVPRPVLDELERQLYDQVAAEPEKHLKPIAGTTGGYEWVCRIPDPEAKLVIHQFVFRFRYRGHSTLQVRECWHFDRPGNGLARH